jgi:hypothetical protein
MSRAVSYNWEIDIDGQIIHPAEIGEFGEGEEGRIEVADGDRKYKIRDQIFNIDEIEVTILLRKTREEYDIMQDWCTSGVTKDVFLIGRDSAKVAQLTFLLTNTDCAMGKLSAFNRKSKDELRKKFVLLPEYVEEII